MLITEENYKKEIEEASGVTVLDFFAEWCGPCRMLSPVIEEVAEMRGDVKFCKCNVDDSPQVAEKFGIMSIPTLVFFRDGVAKETSVGYIDKDELIDRINAI